LFGPHLIIDGSRCNTQKLADRILVEQVLNEYPTAIGMTKIGGPYMFEYQAPDPAYSGVSGLVVIAESHIAIHTFPELDYFTLDIFSCKNFDHELAIRYIKDAFEVAEMDRMLLQRGLSFRGPHHGRLGATDELIAAADARLATGIISKEPAIPDAPTEATEATVSPSVAGGRMLWPQYGVTPDVGTYGDTVNELDAARQQATRTASAAHAAERGEQALGMRAGARIIARSPMDATLALPDGRILPATTPALVNPTASISGLLDKLSAGGGQGRALGRALAAWERAARDGETTISLTLTAPVIAAGLRETLVYAIERRYVDVIVASADDLYADIYESLGHAHFADDEAPDAPDATLVTAEGQAQTRAFIAEQLTELADIELECTPSSHAQAHATHPTPAPLTGADLWRRLGEALPERAPRKGLLQAAAQAGVAIYTPDLGVSAVGRELLALRARGNGLTLDATGDLLALAELLSQRPQVALLRGGVGLADEFVAQARSLAATPADGQAPRLTALITLGATPGVAKASASGATTAIVVDADATLALPLLTTGLAQRLPGGRPVAARQREAALV